MFDPSQLQTLAAVLRLGSFDQAAAALSVTPSAVSQRIRALEQAAGATLVRRGSPATATATGDRLARHAQDLALLDATLRADLGLARDRPVVRIALNADSLATWALPALAALPDVLFDIVIDDQDHASDLLREGQVMAAITARAAPVQGCDAWPLGALRYRATIAPGRMAEWFPEGPTAAALARAPALSFNAKDGLQAEWAALVAGRPLALPLHRLASTEGFVAACELGLGWAMNPAALADPLIAAGRLAVLAPLPLDLPLVWQVSRRVAGPLAPLTKTLRGLGRDALVQAAS
jgi:LysR family transcriptional regulator (chromosome initiation inhibitor)